MSSRYAALEWSTTKSPFERKPIQWLYWNGLDHPIVYQSNCIPIVSKIYCDLSVFRCQPQLSLRKNDFAWLQVCKGGIRKPPIEHHAQVLDDRHPIGVLLGSLRKRMGKERNKMVGPPMVPGCFLVQEVVPTLPRSHWSRREPVVGKQSQYPPTISNQPTCSHPQTPNLLRVIWTYAVHPLRSAAVTAVSQMVTHRNAPLTRFLPLLPPCYRCKSYDLKDSLDGCCLRFYQFTRGSWPYYQERSDATRSVCFSSLAPSG